MDLRCSLLADPYLVESKMITKNQREILEHTAYRTADGFYCGDSKDMQELIQLGLMTSAGKKPFVPDGYFKLTDAGCKFLKIEGGRD